MTSGIQALTPREMEVMLHVFRGLESKEIGPRLGVSPRTVESLRGRVLAKTKCRNFMEVRNLFEGCAT